MYFKKYFRPEKRISDKKNEYNNHINYFTSTEMKAIFLFLFSAICITKISNAQEEKSPTVKFLTKRGYTFTDSTNVINRTQSLLKWPDTLYYNTSYRATILGSPTIPISFSKIELVKGQYQVTPAVSIGYGYTWFTGKFIFDENDKIIIDPVFFFGLIADVGLQNNFSLNKLTSIFTGGFIGFGAFSLFAGYDYMSKSPSIGLGGRIDLFTVSQNRLKPFGKVREVRKHKKAALPISNE